jgi:Derlin-2/3
MFEGFASAPVSRIFAFISVIVSVLLYLQILDTFQLYFNKTLIVEKYEFWRPFTSIYCYGSFGFSALLHIYNFLPYSVSAESRFFNDRPGDFLVFSLFGWIIMWAYASVFPVLFLGQAFSSYVMYYWAKRSPDNQLLLMGLPIPLLAPWVPIIFILFDLNSGLRGMLADLVGYGAAHAYFFIKDVLGLKFNKRILVAPDWMNEGLLKLLV